MDDRIEKVEDFYLGQECFAIAGFQLFGRSYFAAAGSSNVRLFSLTSRKKHEVAFPDSTGRVNYLGFVRPTMINPECSDLEQILVVNHTGFGLFGFTLFDLVSQRNQIEDKRVKMDIHRLLDRTKVVTGLDNRIYFATANSGTVRLGQMELDLKQPESIAGNFLGVNYDGKGDSYLKWAVYSRKVDLSDDRLSCLCAFEHDGVVNLGIGTDKGVYVGAVKGAGQSNALRKLCSSEGKVINLHYFESSGKHYLAFNELREYAGVKQRTEITILDIDGDPESPEKITLKGLQPMWFKIEDDTLYMNLGKRFCKVYVDDFGAGEEGVIVPEIREEIALRTKHDIGKVSYIF